jgi:hypothetical protein
LCNETKNIRNPKKQFNPSILKTQQKKLNNGNVKTLSKTQANRLNRKNENIITSTK